MMTYQTDSKIAYVLKVFPRLSETFILNEILELESQGHDVEIFSLKPCTEPKLHSGLGRLRAQIRYLGPQGSTAKAWQRLQQDFQDTGLDPDRAGEAFVSTLRSAELKNLLQAMELAIWVSRLGIDHLHSHFATSATWVALLAHKLSGVSFSFTAHAKDIYHQDADRDLLSEALKRASFTVTVTDHNVEQLQKYAGQLKPRIHRIYNGMPLESLRPVLVNPNGKPVVIGVGRLVEKKGFRHLIEACQILKDRGTDFKCVVIGTGVEKDTLQGMLSKLDLEDRVQMKGAQSQDVVFREISESNLLVLPCVVGSDGNKDALPTVLLEAMALGRPVISSDLPGVTEIIDHEETGLLVAQGDSTALADAIQQLLENPALGIQLGKNGRQKAERLFNLSTNVATLGSLFRQTTNGQRRMQLDRTRGA